MILSHPIALVILILALASLQGQVQVAQKSTLALDSVERLAALEEQGWSDAQNWVGVARWT